MQIIVLGNSSTMEVETFPDNNNSKKMKELRPRRTLAEVLWDDVYILMHYFTPLLVIYNLTW